MRNTWMGCHWQGRNGNSRDTTWTFLQRQWRTGSSAVHNGIWNCSMDGWRKNSWKAITFIAMNPASRWSVNQNREEVRKTGCGYTLSVLNICIRKVTTTGSISKTRRTGQTAAMVERITKRITNKDKIKEIKMSRPKGRLFCQGTDYYLLTKRRRICWIMVDLHQRRWMLRIVFRGNGQEQWDCRRIVWIRNKENDSRKYKELVVWLRYTIFSL